MTELTPKPTWLWRRLLSYLIVAVGSVIALIAVFRANDPTNIGVAAIIMVAWQATVYITAPTFEDFTRMVRAAADGVKGVKDMTAL